MVYVKGLKKNLEDKESTKYKRYLYWLEATENLRFDMFITDFKQVSYVPSETEFEVLKSFRVIPWGFQTAFTGEYRVLVLRDPQKVVSTLPEFMLKAGVDRNAARLHKRIEFIDKLASENGRCEVTAKVREPIDRHDKDIAQRISDYEKYANFYEGKLIRFDLDRRLVTFEGGADMMALIYSSQFDLGLQKIIPANCGE